jgi:uncharacterized protein (TIGR00297 family)
MHTFAAVTLAASAPGLGHRLASAALVTLIFAALARTIRGVSASGAVAGAGVCFLLFAGAGWGAFAALVSLFALAWITTRLGYQKKQKLGTAEKREGRTAGQVLANLGVAAVCAGLYGWDSKTVFLLAAAAALSEAAADTVSSEVGQAGTQTAHLITTWEQVAAGTDGGVSALGTLAGTAAAAAVSAVGAATGMIPWRWTFISIVAAVLGMFADSFLGAWLERKRVLNNNAVNFLSTLVAAGAAAGLLSLLA